MEHSFATPHNRQLGHSPSSTGGNLARHCVPPPAPADDWARLQHLLDGLALGGRQLRGELDGNVDEEVAELGRVLVVRHALPPDANLLTREGEKE